jgi:hypothetical protein
LLNPKLSADDYSLVIRTDFTDDAKWQLVCKAIKAPHPDGDLETAVECISDKACAGLAPAAVCKLIPEPERLFLFIVDSQTISNPEHPVLVVDTEDPGRTFRVIPSKASDVEPNLRLANMGFEDFEMSLAADGVYRGM